MSRESSAEWWRENLDRESPQAVLGVLDSVEWRRVPTLQKLSGVGGNAYAILDALRAAGLADRRLTGGIEKWRRRDSLVAPTAEAGTPLEAPPKEGFLTGCEPSPSGSAGIESDERPPLSDEERADYGRRADELASRFGGREPLPPPVDIGVCADARYADGLAGHMEPAPRYAYGLLLLCRECYRARARARIGLEQPLTLAEELTKVAFGTARGDDLDPGEEW